MRKLIILLVGAFLPVVIWADKVDQQELPKTIIIKVKAAAPNQQESEAEISFSNFDKAVTSAELAIAANNAASPAEKIAAQASLAASSVPEELKLLFTVQEMIALDPINRNPSITDNVIGRWHHVGPTGLYGYGPVGHYGYRYPWAYGHANYGYYRNRVLYPFVNYGYYYPYNGYNYYYYNNPYYYQPSPYYPYYPYPYGN